MIDPEIADLIRAGRIERRGLVSVCVLYWMPDHTNLLNEFTWQTDDVRPAYPRVKRFLDYWQQSIEARIREVRLMDGPITGRQYRNASAMFGID